MSSSNPANRRAWRLPLAWGVFVVAAVAAGAYAEPPFMRALRAGERIAPRLPAPATELRVLLYQLGIGSVTWFAAVAALPFMVWGARHIRFGRDRHRAVAGVVAAFIVIVVISASIDYLVTFPAQNRPPVMAFLPMGMRLHFLPWAAIFGAVGVFEARRRSRLEAIERERLRAEVAEQRLVALSSQLQPHFLFNTLQGISTLIHRDPTAADAMLTRLSDLLRDVLGNRDRTRVTLADEIRYARTYLEIAQIRFGQRLSFTIDVPDELGGASVPVFLLQPLIENALKHGVGSLIRGGSIAIRARRNGARLHIEVADDGPGFGVAAPPERVGLGNTRERLQAAFPDSHRLSLSRPETNGSGAVVEIEMPWQEEGGGR